MGKGTRIALLVALASLASSARAQQFELNQFRPSEITRDGFAISTASDQRHLDFGVQLYVDFSDDSLVAEPGTAGSNRARVVHRQLTGHLVLSLGLWDRLVVFAGLPYHFIVKEGAGDISPGSPLDLLGVRPTGGGLGDLWLGARVRLWGERKDVVQLAAQGTLQVHTASLADGGQNYLGGPNQGARLGGHLELLATFNLGDDVRLSANVGYRIVDNVLLLPDQEIGDTLTFGAGLIYELLDDQLALIGELYGRTAFSGSEETPVEFLAGVKYFHRSGFTVGAGGGMGISEGIGAPDYRVLGMVGYAMGEKSEEAPEQEPPVEEEAQDESTDDDIDGDGIPNDVDGAPEEPEDIDQFEDEDGVPDPDNDGDDVPDNLDRCPNEGGLAKYYGCLTPQLVELEYDDLAIAQRVFFATGRSRIDRPYLRLLNEVAQVLRTHREILLVNIVGHADTRGAEQFNLGLSQQRANAVRRYLLRKGIDGGRLTAQGAGELKPQNPDAVTDEEHAVNRRVEFKIFGRTHSEAEAVDDTTLEY